MAEGLRWGIAGSGKISSDFVNAIQHDGQTVIAVAARSEESAQKFGHKFGLKKYYSHYDALAEDKDIDVVYVGTINTTHFKIVKSLLMARKPVLCEKPMCLSLAQTEELVALAKKQNTFLMEALWSRFFPSYQEMKKQLDNSELGELSHAYAAFGVPISEVPRVKEKNLGGGSMLDIGIYAVNFILWAMGGEKPEAVQAMGTLNDQGVEGDVSASFSFSNGRFGTFIVSNKSILPNEAFVTGSKGTLKLEAPFWCSLGLTSPSGNFKAPLDQSDRDYNYGNSQGLKFQAREVVECIKKGLTESSLMPLSQSLLLAELIQTVRQKVGAVQY